MGPWGEPFWLLTLGYGAGALLAAAVGWIVLRHRAYAARWFAGGTFAVAAWCLGTAAQLLATTTEQYLVLSAVTYGVVVVAGVLLLGFANIYTGHDDLVTRGSTLLLLLLPSGFLVALLTNPFHGLFYAAITTTAVGGQTVLAGEPGPLFWLSIAYTDLLFLAATYRILVWAIPRFGRYRMRAISLAVGAALPWLTSFGYRVLAVGQPADPTPVAVAFGAPFLAFGAFYAASVDIGPIGRSAAFDAIAEAVVVIEAGTRVVEANEAGQALLGVSDPVGSHIETLLPAALMAEDDTPHGVEIGGEYRWYRRQAVPLSEESDVEVLLFTDVTGLVRTERNLREQNRRLEEFAEVAAHDLRNPLTIIDGMTELTQETGDLSYLERIPPAVSRMETLVDDLLALGRQGRVIDNPDPEPLVPVVEQAWDRAVEGDAAVLTVDADGALAVRADDRRLQQLFESLFANTVLHAGSDVHVWVGTLPDGFYIADDGPGIPESERESVLEYGYSTHREGTGLGLPIVKSIVTAHRWDLALTESETGGLRVEIRDVEFAPTAAVPE